jgi:hypothetical protein
VLSLIDLFAALVLLFVGFVEAAFSDAVVEFLLASVLVVLTLLFAALVLFSTTLVADFLAILVFNVAVSF